MNNFKVCPNCKEKNNPSFSCCWKCKKPFLTETLSIDIKGDMGARNDKKVVTLEEYVAILRKQGIADEVIKQKLLGDLDKGGGLFEGFFKAMDITPQKDIQVKSKTKK